MLTRIRLRPLLDLARRDLGGPLDMVNLITTGRFERYRWYALLVTPAMAAFRARLLWMGRLEHTASGERQADKLLIVRYPSQRHFLAMTLNPYYLAINRLREAGVRRFEASLTRASHCDAGLARRRELVGVHFASPPGRDALGEVAGLAEGVAGELVYATRAVGSVDFLDPPRDSDPHPLRLDQIALFAPAGDAPAKARLAELGAKLAGVTEECSLGVYRREPRSAYRPTLLPALRGARAA